MRDATVRVLAGCELWLYPPPALWGRVLQPSLVLTDNIPLIGAWTQGLDRQTGNETPVQVDSVLGTVTLRPSDLVSYPASVFNPNTGSYPTLDWEHSASMTLVSSDVPGIGKVWEFVAGSGVYQHYYDVLDPYGERLVWVELAKGVPASDSRRWALALSDCQAARFRWYLEAALASGANRGSVLLAVAVTDWDAPVDSGELEWYGLLFQDGTRPSVLRARAGLAAVREQPGTALTWVTVKDVFGDGGVETQFTGVSAYREEARSGAMFHTAEAFVAPHRLVWRVGGVSQPILVPFELPGAGRNDGDSDDVYRTDGWTPRRIRALYVRWTCFRQFRFNGSPVYFEDSAVWESNDHNVGFEPLTPPSLEPRHVGVRSVPGGVASASLVDNTAETLRLARYRLTLGAESSVPRRAWRGRDHVLVTPLVEAVDVRYAGLTSEQPMLPTAGYPSSVQVVQQFDLGRLQISSRAELVWSDSVGEASNRFLNRGLEAVRLWGTRLAQSDSGAVVADDTQVAVPIFTGYANWQASVSAGAGGHLDTRVSCVDRSVQLQQPHWWLPFFDGWNVYYVMYYLAQLGGVRDEFIGFLSKVPPSPFDEVPGSQAWFLPVGSAGTPLTRFSGIALWDIMSRIAKAIGYLLYFDVNGVLQFHKYRIPSGGRYLIAEDDIGVDSAVVLPALNASYSRSMGAVRNEVLVVGVDAYGPLWLPIVSKRSDEASLYDPSAFNYVGFPSRAVWADAQFAVEEFAARAADALFRYLSAPAETLSVSTWFTPDLYAGDVVYGSFPRFGVGTVERYLVVGVSHSLSRGSVGQTHLQLRWLPASLVEEEIAP